MAMTQTRSSKRSLVWLACGLLLGLRLAIQFPGWLALNQGMRAWRTQDLGLAIDRLQRATQRVPTSAAAWRAQGRVQLAQVQPAAARSALEKALALQSHDRLTHLELARALEQVGADDEAQTHYRQAGWPAYASLRRQAQAALSRGAVRDAVKRAGQAAAVEPTRAEAFYLWGEALWAQGDQPAAVSQWQAGLALAAKQPAALDDYYEGRVALARSDPAAAVIALQTAWRLDATLPWTGLWLGEALLADGQPAAAANAWQEQTRRFPANPWAYRRLGDLARAQGDAAAAQRWYDLADSR
jgi:tetratricopeptide (TPR) repeat protein